jgi:O-antigen/teichoic acid export membrane protein
MWCGGRAVFVGHGEFGRIAAASVAYLSIALVGSLLLLWSGGATAVSLILTVAGASMVSGAVLSMLKRNLFSSSGRRLTLSRAEYTLTGSSIAATFVTLVQNNGPLALGPSWGIGSEDLVVYAGVITLVRVPLMLLNNVMAPLNLRFVELSDRGERQDLHRLSLLVLATMLASILLVMLIMIGLGRFGFQILIGTQYEFDISLALGATLAEGFIWLTVVPRLLGSARGAGSVLFGSWAIGLIAFAAAWALGPDGTARLVVAPTVSAAVVMVLAMPRLLITKRPLARLR